ncbi:MAG TPA: hypothetical protein DC032_09160 [Pseudomonas sp.]|nr:hypothetical protein [Pseudomonas sp.]
MKIEEGLQLMLEEAAKVRKGLFEQVVTIHDSYMKNADSYKGIHPTVVCLGSRLLPTWKEVSPKNSLITELPLSATDAFMCEFSFAMSDKEALVFLDADEDLQKIRLKMERLNQVMEALQELDELVQG